MIRPCRLGALAISNRRVHINVGGRLSAALCAVIQCVCELSLSRISLAHMPPDTPSGCRVFLSNRFAIKKTAVRRFKRSSLRVRYCYKDPAEPPPSPYNKKNPQDNKRRP